MGTEGIILLIILIWAVGAMFAATAFALNSSFLQNFSEFDYFVLVAIWPLVLFIKIFKVIKSCIDC